MVNRGEMEDALINKYRADVAARVKGYEKKVKTQVASALEDEYNLVILGKAPKAKKVKEKFDFGK